MCKFGPKVESKIMPCYMQVLLKTTQKKMMKKRKCKKKKKIIPKYGVFLVNKMVRPKVRHIGKIHVGNFVKQGCQ